jgi:transposase InsO family protein
VRLNRDPQPGSLVRVDVKKLGNIPDGGGWRCVGRRQGKANRAATPDKPKSKWYGPKMGHAFVHSVIDDHSRVAYAEVHDDETAVTATGVLCRAVAWFAERDVTVGRVLSDNGGAYRSYLWRDACETLGIRPKWTRPYRPQTNGKVERFHRTMADGWAYARCYNLRDPAPWRTRRLAAPLQPPPTPHRLRQPAVLQLPHPTVTTHHFWMRLWTL